MTLLVLTTGPWNVFIVVPAAGFTQRATLDPDSDEIHVLSVSRLILFPNPLMPSISSKGSFKQWSPRSDVANAASDMGL